MSNFTSLVSRIQPDYVLAFLAGALMTLAYSPFDLWWLAFLGPTALLWLAAKNDLRGASRCGFFFGLGWFGAGISWVHVSIDQFGGLPLVVSLLLMVCLCAYLALYPMLAMFLIRKLTPFSLWPLAFPVAWYVTEWLRSWVLTGFPWLSLGYTQTTSFIGALAPYTGETGVTMLMTSICACLFLSFKEPQRRLPMLGCITAMLLLCVVLSGQQQVEVESESTRVALVQGNIKQDLKWDPEMEKPTQALYTKLSLSHTDADLIVWPEAAIPSIEALSQEFIYDTDDFMASQDTALISGIIDYQFDNQEFYNNLIVMGKRNRDDTSGSYYYQNNNRYQKHHLLPIGEFVPFQSVLKDIAPLFNLPMSSFSRGEYQQDNLIANGLKIAAAMCYEIVYPRQLRANVFDDTDMLLTVSNDAWFGDSHGPHQHMQMAQMRAREFGRPLVRATNNGVTALVDHNGIMTEVIPQFEENVLAGEIYLTKGTTVYARYGEWLNLAIVLALMVVTQLLRWVMVRNHSKGDD